MSVRLPAVLAVFFLALPSAAQRPDPPIVLDVSPAEEGVPFIVRGKVTGLPRGRGGRMWLEIQRWDGDDWTSEQVVGLDKGFSGAGGMEAECAAGPEGQATFACIVGNAFIWHPGRQRARFHMRWAAGAETITGPWTEYVVREEKSTRRLAEDVVNEANDWLRTGVVSRRYRVLMRTHEKVWEPEGGGYSGLDAHMASPEELLDDIQTVATDAKLSLVWRGHVALKGVAIARNLAEWWARPLAGGGAEKRAGLIRRAELLLPVARQAGERWQWVLAWEVARLAALTGKLGLAELNALAEHPERMRSRFADQWIDQRTASLR